MATKMTNETTAIAERDFALPDDATLEARFKAIEEFQKLVRHHLKQGHDYGAIPGTGDRMTLLKPGAEKVAKLMGLADHYEIIEEVRDWDRPLFAFTVKCQLVSMQTGQIVSEGLGECNSRETKYRYRQGSNTCPACGKETIIKGKAQYGGGWLCWDKKGGCGKKWPSENAFTTPEQVENLDVADQLNTIIKMAKKRSLVDAALSAGRLSDIFTQDMEPPETSPSRAPETTDSRAQDAPPSASSSQEAPESEEEAHARGTDEMLGADEPETMTPLARFMKSAREDLGLGVDDVKRILEVDQPSEIGNLGEAWTQLEAQKAAQP